MRQERRRRSQLFKQNKGTHLGNPATTLHSILSAFSIRKGNGHIYLSFSRLLLYSTLSISYLEKWSNSHFFCLCTLFVANDSKLGLLIELFLVLCLIFALSFRRMARKIPKLSVHGSVYVPTEGILRGKGGDGKVFCMHV